MKYSTIHIDVKKKIKDKKSIQQSHTRIPKAEEERDKEREREHWANQSDIL